MSRSTFSRHISRFPSSIPPQIVRGEGASVFYKGERWIDWVQGLGGTGVFGHMPEHIRDVLWEAAEDGIAFHLPSPYEDEAAEAMIDVLSPFVEDVRFCLNGTDATAGAVRLARAVTGRDRIIIFDGHYHGDSSADWAIAGKKPARGVPLYTVEPIIVAKFNNLDSVRKHFVTFESGYSLGKPVTYEMADFSVAAIMLSVEGEAPTPEFVRGLRELCDDYGALLIVDDVVTGFRLALGGACELYGIEADLACYGKALGSGVPIAALAGKREYMREFDLDHTNAPVFMSFTHAGNALGLAAAKATIETLRDGRVLDHIWEVGEELMDRFVVLAERCGLEDVAYVAGQPPRHSWKFREANGVKPHEMLALFQQRMAERGVLVGWTNCPTAAHGRAEIEQTMDAVKNALASVSLAVKAGDIHTELAGDVPTPLYVRKQDQ